MRFTILPRLTAGLCASPGPGPEIRMADKANAACQVKPLPALDVVLLVSVHAEGRRRDPELAVLMVTNLAVRER